MNLSCSTVSVILALRRELCTDVASRVALRTRDNTAALVIQRVFRGFRCRRYYRHRFTKEWKQMVDCVGLSPLLLLEPFSHIRTEWTIDSRAWVYSMKQPSMPGTVEAIKQECKCGYWGETSHVWPTCIFMTCSIAITVTIEVWLPLIWSRWTFFI